MAKKYSLKHSKLKIEFLNRNLDEIVKVYLKHEGQPGLVETWVDAGYNVRSIKFEKVRFWKRRFPTLPAEPIGGRKVVNMKWIFGQVLWGSDNKIWVFKYPLLIYENEDNDYFNLIESINGN